MNLNIFFYVISAFLRTNSRSTYHSAIRSSSISRIELPSRTSCIFVRSFLLLVDSPSFTATYFRRIKQKSFPHPTLALLVESSNLPSPHIMIEFRLVWAVTYNLTMLYQPISIPDKLGRRITGVASTFLSLIIAEKSLFRCLGQNMIYDRPTWVLFRNRLEI